MACARVGRRIAAATNASGTKFGHRHIREVFSSRLAQLLLEAAGRFTGRTKIAGNYDYYGVLMVNLH
jgi:hypothetical protein